MSISLSCKQNETDLDTFPALFRRAVVPNRKVIGKIQRVKVHILAVVSVFPKNTTRLPLSSKIASRSSSASPSSTSPSPSSLVSNSMSSFSGSEFASPTFSPLSPSCAAALQSSVSCSSAARSCRTALLCLSWLFARYCLRKARMGQAPSKRWKYLNSCWICWQFVSLRQPESGYLGCALFWLLFLIEFYLDHSKFWRCWENDWHSSEQYSGSDDD